MHANTIFKETKTLAVLAVAMVMVLAAAAIVLSSESNAETTEKYQVVVLKYSESGSCNEAKLKLSEGASIYWENDENYTLHVGALKSTITIPTETDRYTYAFSGWMYKATGADDSEYVDLPATGYTVSEPITIYGAIEATTKTYQVNADVTETEQGSVQWYDSDGNKITGPITVSYRSSIYTDGDTLYVEDEEVDPAVSYTAVAVPAGINMDAEEYYIFDAWDLSVSQVLADVDVIASFEGKSIYIVNEDVKYKITDAKGNAEAYGFVEGITSITVPDTFELDGMTITPTAVSEGAFDGCDTATSVSLGMNVASIGDNAFDGAALKSITVSGDNSSFASVKGVLYDKDVSVLLKYPAAKQRLVIPDTVVEIADYAFADAGVGLSSNYIRYMAIPSNVQTIGDSAFAGSTIECLKFEDGVTTLGANAFAGCTALNYIIFPSSIETAGDGAFDGCVFHGIDGSEMTYDPSTFKGYKFTSESDYTELNVYVPAAHSSIHKDGYIYRIVNSEQFTVRVYGFDSESIANVVIPETISYLGFEYGVTGILKKAFYGDKTITSVECYGTISYKAFANCSNLESITVYDADVIGDYAFSYCTSLESADFGDSLTNIGKSAFFGCTKLDTFDLANVSVIGERAFARCPLSVAILENATKIGLGAFTGTALTKVVFGESLKSLDSRAFYGYTFYDANGAKMKVTIDNMSGVWFSGEGTTLTCQGSILQ